MIMIHIWETTFKKKGGVIIIIMVEWYQLILKCNNKRGKNGTKTVKLIRCIWYVAFYLLIKKYEIDF